MRTFHCVLLPTQLQSCSSAAALTGPLWPCSTPPSRTHPSTDRSRHSQLAFHRHCCSATAESAESWLVHTLVAIHCSSTLLQAYCWLVDIRFSQNGEEMNVGRRLKQVSWLLGHHAASAGDASLAHYIGFTLVYGKIVSCWSITVHSIKPREISPYIKSRERASDSEWTRWKNVMNPPNLSLNLNLSLSLMGQSQ